jgi:nucleotide-binding universal stress UspA family protein
MLDFTSHDTSIIGYVDYLSRILKPEKIHFVHAEAEINAPPGLKKELKMLDSRDTESAKERLCHEVKRHFTSEIPHACEVVSGHPVRALLSFQKLWKADLIIGGRKPKLEGSGLMLHQLVSKFDTSLLLVPEHVGPHLDRILVPSDFSQPSKTALAFASNLSSQLAYGEKKLYVLHVYDGAEMYYAKASHKVLAGGGHPKVYAELNEKLSNTFSAHLEEAIRPFQQGELTFRPLLKAQTPGNSNIGRHIVAAADENQADLIVMGARGQTQIEALSLGSTSEKVIRWDNSFPLLILRQK